MKEFRLSGVPQRLLIRKPFREFVPSLPVVPCLQIEPVALGHAEVMRQSARNIRVDRPLPLHDLVEASRRDADFICEAKDADLFRYEKLFEYDPSWM
jgi:hypothetical protein